MVRETFNNRKVRAVVADDHPLFRDGLIRALTGSGLVDVVADAEDGPSALEAIRKHQPRQSLKVAILADSPGYWPMHCHNTYHGEAGMFTTFDYLI